MTAPLNRLTTIPTARRPPCGLALEDAVAVGHEEVAGGVLGRLGLDDLCVLLLDVRLALGGLELDLLSLLGLLDLRLRRLVLLAGRILERRRLGPVVALAHASAPS